MIEKICEELDITPEELVIENIIKENQQLKEKDLIIAMELEKLQTKNQQLISTLEEIREYIKEELKGLETTTDKITHCLSYQDLIDEYNNVLQIIDKGVKSEKGN